MSAEPPLFLLVVGLLVVAAMVIKDRLERLGAPPLLGTLGLGIAASMADARWGFLDDNARWGLSFLAELGVVCLLFRVGLTSNPAGLIRQLPRVIPTWISNVALAAALGYAAARFVLGLETLSSLVVATALSATSLGVTVAVWADAGALSSPLGEQFVDVAELDDLSTVALMVLLFSALPVVGNGGPPGQLRQVLLAAGGWLVVKGLAFGALCLLFARRVERPLIGTLMGMKSKPDFAIAVAGIGLMIAALAAWLGFSVAIGALFAGLVFSRDRAVARLQPFFTTLYDLFTPFFFIRIGLQLEPAALGSALGWGLVLLAAAVVGKLVGAAAPVWLASGPRPAMLMGVSMIPRAEIALFVTVAVKEQQPEVVPDALYGAIVFVSAITCLAPPLILRRLLDRWRDEPLLARDGSHDGSRDDDGGALTAPPAAGGS